MGQDRRDQGEAESQAEIRTKGSVMELEDSLEGRCIKLAEADGWFARKTAWRGRRGCPDDVFAKNHRTVWVEFKRPKQGVLSRLQVREIMRMKAAGMEVWVVDSTNQFRDILGLPR